MDSDESVLAQLDSVISSYQGLDFYNDTNENRMLLADFRSAVASTVDRIAGHNSVYAEQIDALLGKFEPWSKAIAPFLAGVISSLRRDVENGYVLRLRELAHAEVFGDFLEMAEYLVNEGYKDAAAVMVGGTLESHLRQLCEKHGIELTREGERGPVAKKADTLNAELAKAGAYGTLDQKSVTSWLDLRNKAAHGKYDEYTQQQVAFMIQTVRDFVSRKGA